MQPASKSEAAHANYANPTEHKKIANLKANEIIFMFFCFKEVVKITQHISLPRYSALEKNDRKTRKTSSANRHV